MTPEEHAKRVAKAWQFPGGKPRTHPPVAPIEYLAEKAFWSAQHIDGFAGDLEAWTALVRSFITEELPLGPAQHKRAEIAVVLPIATAPPVAPPALVPAPAADLAPAVQWNPYNTDL